MNRRLLIIIIQLTVHHEQLALSLTGGALEHVFLFLYQLQVRCHNDSGMYEDASKFSKQASLFVKIGLLIGSIAWTVVVFIIVIVIVVRVAAE